MYGADADSDASRRAVPPLVPQQPGQQGTSRSGDRSGTVVTGREEGGAAIKKGNSQSDIG
jgi:hypothetical protein